MDLSLVWVTVGNAGASLKLVTAMSEPTPISPVLKFGRIAAPALALAVLFGGIGYAVGGNASTVGRGLWMVAMLSGLASTGIGLLGVLRFFLAVSARPLIPGDRLGLVLCAIPVGVAYLAMELDRYIRSL